MNHDPQQAAAIIKSWAREIGFDLVGIALPEASAYAAAYRDWIDSGRHGEMAYLARNIEERLAPLKKFPWARSAVCVALSYWRDSSGKNESEPRPSGSGFPSDGAKPLPDGRGSDESGAGRGSDTNQSGKIARYAWGRDYHRVMEKKFKRLEERIRHELRDAGGESGGLQIRAYCDTGPVMEREWAARAGLGWIGKNTLLIHPRHGSWFVLGELILSLELAPDAPLVDHCGTCTRCIDACPTDAISAGPERSVDARRCISYLTLEHRQEIAGEFEEPMREAGYLIGCDICQEVCPFNGAENPDRKPLASREPDFAAAPPAPDASLAEILAWQESDWDRLTRGRPFRRAKLPMWQRTAGILQGK